MLFATSLQSTLWILTASPRGGEEWGGEGRWGKERGGRGTPTPLMLKLMNSNRRSCNLSTRPEIWGESYSHFPLSGKKNPRFFSVNAESQLITPCSHRSYPSGCCLLSSSPSFEYLRAKKMTWKVTKSACLGQFEVFLLRVRPFSCRFRLFHHLILHLNPCPAATPWIIFYRWRIFHGIGEDGQEWKGVVDVN